MGTPKKLRFRMRDGADSRFIITTNSTSSTYQLQNVVVSAGTLTWYVTGDIDPIPAPQTTLNPIWNFSGNTGLIRVIAVSSDKLISVYRNWIKDTVAIDVTECPVLDRLEIEQGWLTEVDLSQNSLLTDCTLSRNSLTVVDFTNNPLMWRIEVDYNQLTSSFNDNLPFLQNLTSLTCNANSIGNVNVGAISGLTNINISANGMSGAWSFPNNAALTVLKMNTNTGITSLDVTNLSGLTWLDFAWLNIGTIDLSNNTALTYLKFNLNYFSSGITISQCTNLTTLICNDNGMTTTGTDFMWNQMSTIATNGSFTGGVITIRNNRTTASDAAYSNLVSRSYTITQTTS